MKELIAELRAWKVASAPYEPEYKILAPEVQLRAADALERLTKEAAHRKQLHEAEVADLTAERDALFNRATTAEFENAALKAELDVLKADADRYRWLNEKCTDADWACLKYESDNWRNAYIDAAIAGEAK